MNEMFIAEYVGWEDEGEESIYDSSFFPRQVNRRCTGKGDSGEKLVWAKRDKSMILLTKFIFSIRCWTDDIAVDQAGKELFSCNLCHD